MAEFTVRGAGLDDAAEIHSLLLALAPEIPLRIERLEDEERLYALVRNCARSGESWVALDDAGRIIGFVLVQPTESRRHYAEREALELHHAGVASDYRKLGVFGELLANVLARMLPVVTTANPQNRSGITGHLEKRGFHRTDTTGGEHRLRWQPGASS